MAEFTANFQDKEVQNFLRSLDSKLKQVKDGHKKYNAVISSIVFGDVMSHFKDEKGPEGKWKSWSKPYAKFMASIGKGGNKILQDTGKMRNAFKPQEQFITKSNSIGWFNDAQTKSGFPYAFAHDEGGPKLPKRSFMWLSDKGVERISVATLGFLLDEGIK